MSGKETYLANLPDVIDSWLSPAAAQPQDALVGWRKQLASGNLNTALQYVYLPNRQAFRDVFVDPANQATEAAGTIANAQTVITDCKANELCQQRATIIFVDTVATAAETDINGAIVLVPARATTVTVDLLKNIFGKWQLLDESH